jgi:hypothetical protein
MVGEAVAFNLRRTVMPSLRAGPPESAFRIVCASLNDMEAAIRALGRQMGASQLAMFTVWGFLVGIFAVWLYAGIRPRYGAGPKTALCAGAAVWGLGYLLASVTPPALKLRERERHDIKHLHPTLLAIPECPGLWQPWHQLRESSGGDHVFFGRPETAILQRTWQQGTAGSEG